MKYGWLDRLRLSWRRLWQALPVLGIAGVLSGGDALYGQDTLPYWSEALSGAAQSADHSPHPPVRFVWIEDEESGSSDETQQPIRRTAYQNQYPLSKDAEDLLPYNLAPSPLDAAAADADTRFADGDSPWIEWKKTVGTATWIAPSSGGLGISSLEARGSVEFPNFPAMWFAPRIAAHWLSGPTETDLPAQLFDFSFETVGALPLGERWTLQAAIAPSVFTDSNNTGRHAFRLPGRALAFWKYSESLTLTGGVLYLDRDDVQAIPSAGVLWYPRDDWKFELVAPRPRIAWRFSQDDGSARWAYLVGEFGGGTWAIRRASGVHDVATLSDYRLMLGYERKWTSGRSWAAEAGYVFSRQSEYTSGIGDTDLPGAALVRLGATY